MTTALEQYNKMKREQAIKRSMRIIERQTEPFFKLTSAEIRDMAIARMGSQSARKAIRPVAIAQARANIQSLDVEIALNAGGLNIKPPTTRAECKNGIRPCPWARCRHHLYNPISITEGGSVRIDYDLSDDIDEWGETCSLDLADQGGMTLEEVGDVLGVTRERVRQIVDGALGKLAAQGSVGALANDARGSERSGEGIGMTSSFVSRQSHVNYDFITGGRL